MSAIPPSKKQSLSSKTATARTRDSITTGLAPQEQQSLLAHLPIAVYRLDAHPPHNMTFVDGALEAIVGYKPTEWLSQPQAWKQSIHEEDRPRCLRKLAFALQSGIAQEWQHRYINRNGNTIWVKHRLQPIFKSPDQPCTSITGHLENVTVERLLTGKSLEGITTPAASQAQGLTRLAGGIAHDFNNALTSILGNAQFLLRDHSEEEPSKKCLLEIISSGERVAELTQDLLSFSRIKKQPATILDLNDLLDSMTPLLREQLNETQKLVISLSADPVLINGHRDQLEQTVIRLVENSRDAMPKNGVITLQTQRIHPDSPLTLPEQCPKDQALAYLTVSDTGSGIPEDVRPYIFDPFYSTREDPQYRGLGLSLALHTIERHKGFIETTSSPEQGTTMHIYLPCQEGVQALASQQAPGTPIGTETILFVEDDTPVRSATEKILKSLNYTVLSARDAKEALNIMRQQAAKIDLALLDIFMPDMDGFTLMQQLRELKPTLQSLYISGYAQEALPENETACESTNFVSKPYSREKLGRALRNVLNEAHT